MSRSNTTVCSWEASAQFDSVSEGDTYYSSGSMGILNEIPNLYEERMRILETDSSSGNDDLKITTLKAWVYDLGEENKLLVHSLEELEQSEIRRNKLFKENGPFGTYKRKEVLSYETLVYHLSSDLKNICKLIRRGLETKDWSTKCFKFFKLNDWEIFGPMLHSLNATKYRKCKSTQVSFVEGNAPIASFESKIRNLPKTVHPCDGIEEIFLKRNVRESTSSLTFKATCLTPESCVIETNHYQELLEIQKKDLENLNQEIQKNFDRDSLPEIELKRRLEENEKIIEENRRVTSDLQQQLAESRKDNQTLRNKLREKEELLHSASKRYKDDVNTVKTQAERLISLGNSFNERKQEILDLQSENRNLSNTIKGKDKEIMDILVRHTQKRICCSCTSKEEKISALKTEVQTILKSLQEKDDRLQLLTNENAKLYAKVKKKNKDVEDSKRELHRYKKQFEDNKKQFASMTTKIFEEQQMTAEAVTVANNQLEMHLKHIKRQ